MFMPIGFLAASSEGSTPTGSFTLTSAVGASERGYVSGSTYYLGSYGMGNPYDNIWNIYLDVTSSNITGTVSSIQITLNNLVLNFGTPATPIKVWGITNATRSTGSMTLLATTSNIVITNNAFTFTLTGSNLQNWFNGTTYNGITLDANPGYYNYWWGFSGLSFVLT